METNRDIDWREEKTASQCLEHLYLSERLADVTFTFASQPLVKLPAHKFVLSMRSNVFEAMFYGSMAENSDTIRFDDIDPEVMKLLLRYVYTDETSLDGDRVLHCLYAAKKYNLGGLVKLCSNYLKNKIDYGNVCTIHEQAVFFAMNELQMQCFDYIQENAQPVLASPDFENLSQQTLLRLLSSNDFGIAEEEIFKSAMRWAKHHCSMDGIEATAENMRASLGDTLYQIRFPLLDIGFFATSVTPAGILRSEEQIMLYQYLATKGSTELNKFIKEERRGKLLVIDTTQFSEHDINENGYYLEFTDPIQPFSMNYLGRGGRGGRVTHGRGGSRGGYARGSYQNYQVNQTNLASEQPQRLQTKKSALKLVSISGDFVQKVERVRDRSSADTDIKFFKTADRITFTQPLGNLDGLCLSFVLYDDGWGGSVYVNTTLTVKGESIKLVQMPNGTTSLSFS